MANPKINAAGALAALDAVVDRVDLGTTNPQGRLRIYSGTQPADADAGIGGATLLAELNMSNPAFGASADQNPNARATASTITDDSSADATGTAAWFRIVDRDGNGVIDGDVTANGGGGDLQLNSINLTAGANVSVSSLTVDLPQ